MMADDNLDNLRLSGVVGSLDEDAVGVYGICNVKKKGGKKKVYIFFNEKEIHS